jgi:hypothetical protein
VCCRPHEYPESGFIVLPELVWSKRIRWDRAVRLSDDARSVAVMFASRFAITRVIIEKFIDNSFEYSFAYEYWPTGNIRCVVSTRARLGVLLEEFDEV